MMKWGQITLYDIFGYFLPGMIVLVAISILFWSIYLPEQPFVLRSPAGELWIACGVIAYLLGHLNQAVGNLLVSRLKRVGRRIFGTGERASAPEGVVICAKAKMTALFGFDASTCDHEWLFKICDETVSQIGYIGDREVYQYRS